MKQEGDWRSKYAIVGEMLKNSRKWVYSTTDPREGEKTAREIIRRDVKDALKAKTARP